MVYYSISNHKRGDKKIELERFLHKKNYFSIYFQFFIISINQLKTLLNWFFASFFSFFNSTYDFLIVGCTYFQNMIPNVTELGRRTKEKIKKKKKTVVRR
jgi:hypothetical protein